MLTQIPTSAGMNLTKLVSNHGDPCVHLGILQILTLGLAHLGLHFDSIPAGYGVEVSRVSPCDNDYFKVYSLAPSRAPDPTGVKLLKLCSDPSNSVGATYAGFDCTVNTRDRQTRYRQAHIFGVPTLTRQIVFFAGTPKSHFEPITNDDVIKYADVIDTITLVRDTCRDIR